MVLAPCYGEVGGVGLEVGPQIDFGHVITLNKCLKGHKSLGLLLGGVL